MSELEPRQRADWYISHLYEEFPRYGEDEVHIPLDGKRFNFSWMNGLRERLKTSTYQASVFTGEFWLPSPERSNNRMSSYDKYQSQENYCYLLTGVIGHAGMAGMYTEEGDFSQALRALYIYQPRANVGKDLRAVTLESGPARPAEYALVNLEKVYGPLILQRINNEPLKLQHF